MVRFLFLLLFLFLVGWVAWPAFSAYQIYGGVQSADEGVLQRKINWDSLRNSLRPVVAVEVEKAISRMSGNGTAVTIGPELQKQLAPQLVEAALKNIVTPKGLLEVIAHGGDVSAAVSKMVGNQTGRLGGLEALGGGQGGGLLGNLLGNKQAKDGLGGLLGGLGSNDNARESAGSAPGNVTGGDSKPEAAYGLANLKRFSYTGPAALEVGVAKDPAADDADLTAVMEFQDFDWKLTGLVPRIR